jgi:peptidoglycan/LPS O-acetylase OafA/YrhL
VGIFFALSGFLIASLLAKIPRTIPDLLGFVARRIFRIYPLFVAVLITVFICLPKVSPEKGQAFHEGFVRLLTLTEMPQSSFGYGIGVMWTLQIEFIFYLMAPIMVFVLGHKKGIVILSIVLIAVGWHRDFVGPHGLGEDSDFATFLHWGGALGLGSLLSILAAGKWLEKEAFLSNSRLVLELCLAGLVFLLAFAPSPSSAWHLEVFIAALLACGLIAVYLNNDRFFVSPLLSAIGKISYSIYLIHAVLLDYGDSIFGIKVYGNFPMYLLAVLGISCVTYLLIEKPGVRLGAVVSKAIRSRSVGSVSEQLTESIATGKP